MASKKAIDKAKSLAYGAELALQSISFLDKPESQLRCIVKAKSNLREALKLLGD